ncbi:hypothetical protein NFX46_02025 [Streptomyces phaeoluteigriseus]|uniref:Uncharacterized protein n=1 Tax=Streptomyces phaeoluteigriseus TaxID=114686 RepID=A0ABY4Z221_9ACTN|nr:hypothetical protein [Streptomyces phaeoluteigriseus]USQ82653.1 hypothetical protein NFX46_02025 [Streptomyces phaeoluteigriseus]
MTTNEISMLAIGITVGAQMMNVLNAYWASRDARRSETQAVAALKQATGDRYLNSLRLYQLQHRTEARR